MHTAAVGAAPQSAPLVHVGSTLRPVKADVHKNDGSAGGDDGGDGIVGGRGGGGGNGNAQTPSSKMEPYGQSYSLTGDVGSRKSTRSQRENTPPSGVVTVVEA